MQPGDKGERAAEHLSRLEGQAESKQKGFLKDYQVWEGLLGGGGYFNQRGGFTSAAGVGMGLLQPCPGFLGLY